MNGPNIEFKILDIEENLDNLVWYLNQENSQNAPLDFYKFMFQLFPELQGKIDTDMNNEQIYMVLDKEIRPILENLAKTSKDVEKYRHTWNKVNDAIMKDLENTLKIKWPDNEKITCRIGLLPVCPRDIKNRTFDVNYGIKDDDLIAIIIHELCHFIYFDKWKEIYPNYREEEFDMPHIAWYLSEAMIDPLINNETFKKYTNADLSAYTIFYETYINDRSVIDILREYVNNNPIEEAIKKGYELFTKYERQIKEKNK